MLDQPCGVGLVRCGRFRDVEALPEGGAVELVASIDSTVHEVIAPYQGSLPSEAGQVVTEMIRALHARESTIIGNLRQTARQQGLIMPAVEQALREAGLTGYMPTQNGAQVSDEARAQLQGMIETVERTLREVKERYGL